MKSFLTLITFLIAAKSLDAQTHDWAWANNLSGFATCTQVDLNGNVYTCGVFSGMAIFDHDTLHAASAAVNDMYLIKHTSDGHIVWAINAGQLGDGNCNLAIGASGDIYMTGNYGSNSASGRNVFASKYNRQNGDLIWSKTSALVQGNAYVLYAPALDRQEHLVLTGSFDGTLTFGQDTLKRPYDILSTSPFLVKYDSSGTVIWAVNALGSGYGAGLCIDGSNNIYISGRKDGTLKFSDEVTSDSVTGIYMAKYAPSGLPLWAKSSSANTSTVGAYQLVCDANANIYQAGDNFGVLTINGHTISGYHNFLASYDSAGNIRWLKAGGTPNYDGGARLTIDAQQRIYYSGTYIDSIAFGNVRLHAAHMVSPYVFAFDASGTALWANGIVAKNALEGCAMGVNSAGEVYLSGNYQDSVTCGQFRLTGSSAYVAKISANTSGVNEVADSKGVLIYPNPSAGLFAIRLSGPGFQNLTVYNVQSTIVYRQTVSGLHEATIDLSQLSQGVYFALFTNREGQKVTKKIIVQH